MDIARDILRELDCDRVTREEIARLVRFHGRPAYLLEKTDPENELISLSWLVSNRLLYLFALADTRGRQPAENIARRRQSPSVAVTAEENGCFETPFPFANDQARFLFFCAENPDRFYASHE